MPLYQYKCENCNEEYEMFVAMELRREKMICPKCGSLGERLLGPSAVYVYSFNPMELNAEKDMGRHERMMKGRLYREDQDKRAVNHLANRSEV